MRHSRALAPIAAFVGLAVIVAVLPEFVSAFRAQQLAYVAIYLCAILGLNVLTGYTGQISLGHGAFMPSAGSRCTRSSRTSRSRGSSSARTASARRSPPG